MGLFSAFKKSGILYYPGCRTYYKFKDNFELYKKILSRLGVGYSAIENPICCGLPALELGYESEARKLARKNLKILKDNNIGRILTNCPGCYKMFSQTYKDLLPDWDIEVVNLYSLILEKLESKPRLIKQKAMQLATYHDNSYLGRYLGIYDEPRRILKLIGYEIKEMVNSKEGGFDAGSSGSLAIVNPKLADEIAKQRVLDAKRIGIKKIIVASLFDYELLKENAKESGVEVIEFSEALAYALGVKEKELEEEEIDVDNNKEEIKA